MKRTHEQNTAWKLGYASGYAAGHKKVLVLKDAVALVIESLCEQVRELEAQRRRWIEVVVYLERELKKGGEITGDGDGI